MKQQNTKCIARRTLQCLAVIGSAGLCLSAMAQDGENLEAGNPLSAEDLASPKPPITATVGGAYQAETDVDKGGKFSLARFNTSVGVPIVFNEKFSLANRVRYDLASYDFSDSSFNPWTSINTLTLVSLLQYKLDENWTIYGGPIARVSAEANSDFSKAWTGGGAAACSYRFSDTLTVGGGFVAMSQIEDDAIVLPIVTVNWKFADDFRLLVGFSDLATAGYGARVVYSIGDFWDVDFGAQFQKSRFRIDNHDAIGQDKSASISASATYKFSQAVSATGFVGMTAGGNLRLETNDGHKIGESDYDTAAFFGLKGSMKF